MRKWEEKFEKLKNGEFDSRIDELKLKIQDKKATKDEFKEYNNLSKSKENVSKIENIIKYRDDKKKSLEEIKKEIEIRENIKKANGKCMKLEEELAEIEKELQIIENSLKDKTIEDKKREEFKVKRTELLGKRDNNNKEYGENQKLLAIGLNREGKYKDYDEKELQDLKLETSSKISKCNMIANSLVNGLSWDSINLKLDNWNKKYTKPEEKTEEKTEEKVEENEEDKNIFSTPDKKKEYEKMMKKNQKRIEFEAKHPRLAKIRNWFRKMVKKDEVLPEPKPQDKPEIKEEKENKKTDESFKDYIRYVAEYGEKDARKEQLKDRIDLKEKLAKMREQNRANEAKKLGQDYADKSDYRNNDDDRSR